MPTKTFKSDHDSEAGIIVSKNVARMNGNKNNYVAVDEKGVTINGPISFVSGSGQIRFGGLWTMNSEMSLSLPSTMATPTPVMVINPPIAQLGNVMKDAVVMMGLMGALAVI